MPPKKPKATAAKARNKNGRKRAASHTPPEGSQPPSPGRAKTRAEDDIQGSNVEGPPVVPADDTKSELEKYVERLEKQANQLQQSQLVFTQNEVYRNGFYNHWTTVGVHYWDSEVGVLISLCGGFAYSHAVKDPTGRYDKILSKEQKKQLILSMDGWVVQENFDSILCRVPPAIRRSLLMHFMEIIILKDIWHLFWENPFWYLSPDPSNEPGLDPMTPFGKEVYRIYQEFKRADLKLAYHWRAQTARLANTFVKTRDLDNAFHAKNVAFRAAKAKEFALARYNDKTFQCLLKDPGPRVEFGLIRLYQHNAEMAMKIAAAQPAMEWGVLKDSPTTFERTSKVIEPVGGYGLHPKERRLNGRRVLAVVNPIFRRAGTWLDYSTDGVIRPGTVLVEDTEKRPPIHYWDPGEAKAKRKKAREEKKARDEKKAREEKDQAKAEGAESADEKKGTKTTT